MGPHNHILLVEDNAMLRAVIRARLEGAGYRVTCAAHGREALDLLRGPDRPCLILLDLCMPVMDGWHFRAVQRQTPSLADIPVFLLSAEDGLADIAASLGVAGYYQKPVEFAGLLRGIRSASTP